MPSHCRVRQVDIPDSVGICIKIARRYLSGSCFKHDNDLLTLSCKVREVNGKKTLNEDNVAHFISVVQ